MQARPFASMTKSLQYLSRAFAVAGMTALLLACAPPGGTVASSIHPPVKIGMFAAGTPCPDGWYCKTQGRYMMAISEDPVNLSRDSRPVTINWLIETAGWTFTRTPRGIQINQGQWDETEVTPTKYAAISTQRDSRTYKYNISVTNGTDTFRWDPVIFND